MCGWCYAYNRYVTLQDTNPQSMGFSRSTNALQEIITRFKKHLQKSSKPCVLGIFYLAFFPKGIKILL